MTPALPFIHWEVKRTKLRIYVYEWMLQAITDAARAVARKKRTVPVVAMRKDREAWLVVVQADDFIELLKRAENLDGPGA